MITPQSIYKYIKLPHLIIILLYFQDSKFNHHVNLFIRMDPIFKPDSIMIIFIHNVIYDPPLIILLNRISHPIKL